jgi:hypothetical protein
MAGVWAGGETAIEEEGVIGVLVEEEGEAARGDGVVVVLREEEGVIGVLVEEEREAAKGKADGDGGGEVLTEEEGEADGDEGGEL